MKAVIQRVANASVTVDGEVKGSIESGFLILLGVEMVTMNQRQKLLLQKLQDLEYSQMKMIK